ncbi:hypothetical protein [Clostridium beijerinckii]|uniref:hypothetical protein n=1 Tax=Clostridium beijerinckii TaxID=1520 RepID=UPI0014941843|nr:hypothetical protein [Clostridium beijerinckii]NOW04792.1 hypothetical protein [Clostridium beijerinckii]NYC02066.1 hypothetical protein [Clostridium beijerinckii]
MDKKMIELQKALTSRNIYNFKISSYEKYVVKIVGYNDFNNSVEIIFDGVSFIECPTKFKGAKIRFGTNEEREWLINNHTMGYMEDEERIFCFDLIGGLNKYYISSEDFDFVI